MIRSAVPRGARPGSAPPAFAPASRPAPLSSWAPRLAPVVLALALASCGGEPPPAADAWAGTPLPGEVRLPDQVLPAVTGGDTPEAYPIAAEGEGRITLLFIGYTYCPDVCPVHLANLGAVLQDLPFRVAREIRTIFVTADPARDTPERLSTWLDALHPDFVGLRGTREEVNALEDALGLPRSVVDPGETPEEYFVGHAGQVLAFDRDGVARMAYPWGIRQRDWRRDLPRMVAGEWPDPAPVDAADAAGDETDDRSGGD